MRKRFIDSHAHLDGEKIAPHLPQILERAFDVGLTELICIGASDGLQSNEQTLKLIDGKARLFGAVGIHPHDAKVTNDEVVARIEKLAEHPQVVGIGETGLDYYYDLSPREAQRNSFARFLALAKKRKLPCIIHTRDAEPDTIEIMKQEGAQDIGGVIHCFTGTQLLADAALAMDFYISFSGVLTFRNADPLRKIAKDLPRDRVLIETDCPFLTPVPHRGVPNEPALIVHTAERLAELWGVSAEEVQQQTGENAARLFKLP